MTVVLNRPYQFVPPYRGNAWPSFIQTFRLIDWHLRRKEGVVDHECRNLDRFKHSLEQGHGILLAPNHCRYADPIVLGLPAREVGTHLFAVASWHLFNTNRFEHFALRRMGGFSLNREGQDRQSLDTAITALAESQRPLVLFPEGTTNRTNDVLKPLLDGVSFIARTAAKKRLKECGGKVVVHPVALKYLCLGNINDWAEEQLTQLEHRLGWYQGMSMSLVERTIRLAEGMLALKEIEYTGKSNTGELPKRRDALMFTLLQSAESALGLISKPEQDVRDRVRVIRSEVVTKYFDDDSDRSPERQASFQQIAEKADFAQNLLSFPDCYLTPGNITDTRLLETIQRIQESIYGKAAESMPLKVIVEIDNAIEVSTQRPPRGQPDPLMANIEDRLEKMLAILAKEANSIG